MCKAWKWAVVGVQREIRSRKVLNTALGSLAFTLGATGSQGRILSRRVSRSDLSLKFTLLCELQEEQGRTRGEGALQGRVEACVPERRWLLVQVCVGVCVGGPRWRLGECVWDLGQCTLGVCVSVGCTWARICMGLSAMVLCLPVCLYYQGCVCVCTRPWHVVRQPLSVQPCCPGEAQTALGQSAGSYWPQWDQPNQAWLPPGLAIPSA